MRCTILSALGSPFFIYLINATPLHSLNPRAAAPLAGYIYSGCYTEATNQRALTGSDYFDDSLTVEKCAAACKDYTRFGVEYGRECYCGDTLNAGSVKASESDCSFACPGNAAQTCGAGNRLDVYEKEPTVPAPPPYTAKGCHTDDPNSRALTATSSANDDLTVELCAAICKGYAYFGVEYFRECYCGNTLASGSVLAPADECDAACNGDVSESCGGSSRLNLYQYSTAT